MQWEFDDIPVSIRLDDGTLFKTGSFTGYFEINDIGLIDKIVLEEHAWPKSNKSIELRRWKPGTPNPGFRGRLFDALDSTLSKAYEDEINECLAEINGWPTAAEERHRELAIYHQQVL